MMAIIIRRDEIKYFLNILKFEIEKERELLFSFDRTQIKKILYIAKEVSEREREKQDTIRKINFIT